MVIYIYTGCGWNIKYLAFALQNKKYKEREREKSQGRICSGECCSVTLLAMDIVTVIGTLYEYSFWDFLGDIFHIRKEESEVIPIVGIISLVVIFVLCYRLVAKLMGTGMGRLADVSTL